MAEQVRNTLDAAFAELESLTELVIRAHDDRAWRRINHVSWEDCCQKEFGAIRLLRLPRGMRKELHQALRDRGLSVRHTAAVTGCSKNTVLEDCSAEKASQTETPEPGRHRNDDALARELSRGGAKEGVEEPDRENVTLTDGFGPTDLMGRVGGAARAVSSDIANLVSLARLARRDGKIPTELADYLGPKVDTWTRTLGSLVEEAAGPTSRRA